MDSFQCSKSIVKEIAEFQGLKTMGFDGEYEKVINHIESQLDIFGYESFMSKLSDFISVKAIATAGNFVIPFKIRMKKYKQGKDWKLI